MSQLAIMSLSSQEVDRGFHRQQAFWIECFEKMMQVSTMQVSK